MSNMDGKIINVNFDGITKTYQIFDSVLTYTTLKNVIDMFYEFIYMNLRFECDYHEAFLKYVINSLGWEIEEAQVYHFEQY